MTKYIRNRILRKGLVDDPAVYSGDWDLGRGVLYVRLRWSSRPSCVSVVTRTSVGVLFEVVECSVYFKLSRTLRVSFPQVL